MCTGLSLLFPSPKDVTRGKTSGERLGEAAVFAGYRCTHRNSLNQRTSGEVKSRGKPRRGINSGFHQSTLTPSPWTTPMNYPKMDYAAEVWWVRKLSESSFRSDFPV